MKDEHIRSEKQKNPLLVKKTVLKRKNTTNMHVVLVSYWP